VDKHLQTVRPSIIAGKIIFMEWPMERNVRIAQEMTELAKKHNAKTILGIQASFSPLARKLRQFIDSGKLGKILSSSYVAAMGSLGANHSKVVRYFLDRSVGGNPVSIHLGHSLEFITTGNYDVSDRCQMSLTVCAVIGQFRNFESLLAVRRTRMDIVDGAAGNQVVQHAAPNNVPDQIMLHGNAEVDNAVHSLMWHGGPAFPDTPALTWRIIGEKGELLVTSSDSQSFNIGPEIPKARYHKLGSSEVEDVVPEEDEFDKLPIPARNIARVYDAFRKGEWFPDFDHGLKRHRMIDRMWKRFDYVNAVNM
jgi:predicted dehydrogenase